MTSTSELPNPSDEMHELTVRPVRGHWEIIDGRESVLTEEQQPPKKEKRGLLRKMKSFQVKDSMKGSRDRGVVPSQKDSFLAFLCGIKTATFRTGIHVTAGEPDFSSSTAGAKSLPRDRKSSTTTLSESMPEYLKPLNTHVDGIVANPTSNLGSAELQALWSLVGKAMDEFDPFSGWDSPLPESDAELLNASPHVVRSYLKTNASEENWLNVELTKSILQITNIVLRKASRAVQKCFREGTDEQKEKYGPLIKLLDVEAHPGNLLVITDTGSGVPGQAGLRAVPDFTVWLRDDDSESSTILGTIEAKPNFTPKDVQLLATPSFNPFDGHPLELQQSQWVRKPAPKKAAKQKAPGSRKLTASNWKPGPVVHHVAAQCVTQMLLTNTGSSLLLFERGRGAAVLTLEATDPQTSRAVEVANLASFAPDQPRGYSLHIATEYSYSQHPASSPPLLPAAAQFSVAKELPTTPLYIAQFALMALQRWQAESRPFPGICDNNITAHLKQAKSRQALSSIAESFQEGEDDDDDDGSRDTPGPSSGGQFGSSSLPPPSSLPPSSDQDDGGAGDNPPASSGTRDPSSLPPSDEIELAGADRPTQAQDKSAARPRPQTVRIPRLPFATGSTARVYDADVDGDHCVAKRYHKGNRGAQGLLSHEIDMLTHSALRGLVPRYRGLFETGRGELPAILMDWAGIEMIDWLEEAQSLAPGRKNVLRCLQDAYEEAHDDLAAAGFCHVDLTVRNVLLSSPAMDGNTLAAPKITFVDACSIVSMAEASEDDQERFARALHLPVDAAMELWPDWYGGDD